MKAHLNVTTDVDDALIAEKIDAASEWVRKYCAIGSDETSIPAPIKEAVRQLAGHLYANREATLIGVTSQALPFGMLDLLAPYRAWAF